MALMTIDEALERVLASATPVSAETISIIDAHGRTLARPLVAKRTQPPFRASAMDGYAVRGADVAMKGEDEAPSERRAVDRGDRRLAGGDQFIPSAREEP